MYRSFATAPASGSIAFMQLRSIVNEGANWNEEVYRMNKRCIATAFAVVTLSFGFFVIDRDGVLAGMNGMHHQHDDQDHHLHSMKTADVVVDLETRPAEIRAGNPATVLFFIKDAEGKPEQDLTITHERLIHVVIASEDFSVFGHIHPDDFGPITSEMKKSARFPVRFTFPKAGKYLLAIDSAVRDIPFSEHFTVDVAGEPLMGPYKKDLSRKKPFGEYEVTLTSDPERIIAGKEATLSYLIKNNSLPVTDLEPYLSAPMHLAIVQADLSNFIHTHGELPGTASGQHHMSGHAHMVVPEKFGPRIDVHIVFPAKGLYQIFGEVKHHGDIIVTRFMVEVE
jgi:Cu+-exporting ATPase